VIAIILGVVTASTAKRIFTSAVPACEWASENAGLAGLKTPPSRGLAAALAEMRRPQP
jgi:hypothetical protein